MKERFKDAIPYAVLILGLAFFAVLVIRADDTKTQPPAPAVRNVVIPGNAAEIYNDAAKATADARRAVETSTVWKDYLLVQAREQTAMVYALAEAGLKPTEGCKPIFDKDNKLQSFECPAAPVPKPKEHEKKL